MQDPKSYLLVMHIPIIFGTLRKLRKNSRRSKVLLLHLLCLFRRLAQSTFQTVYFGISQLEKSIYMHKEKSKINLIVQALQVGFLLCFVLSPKFNSICSLNHLTPKSTISEVKS